MGGCGSKAVSFETHEREIAALRAQLADALAQIEQHRQSSLAVKDAAPRSLESKLDPVPTLDAASTSEVRLDGMRGMTSARETLRFSATAVPPANIERPPPALPQPRGPLWLAAKSGNAGAVSRLLHAGASCEETDESGDSALLVAALGGHADCTATLIFAGANIHAKNVLGWTPLIAAAQKGHTDVAKLLIAAGAQVNEKDKIGRTPLMGASATGRDAIISALIGAGVDVNARTNTGDTALYLARKYGHVDAVALLEAAGAVSSPSPLKGSPSNRTVQHSNPGSPGGYSPSTQSARSLDGFARSRSALSPNIAAVAV